LLIYLNNEFKCHVKNDGTMLEAQSDFFNDKCKEFIEGYRFIPSNYSWTREDGTVFTGEMIVPFKPYSELNAAQREYERELAEAARILLGGNQL
jgi:ribosomal protein L24E